MNEDAFDLHTALIILKLFLKYLEDNVDLFNFGHFFKNLYKPILK